MRAVKLFVLSVVLAVASLPVLGAQQTVFGGFYGFGDSLADNGNVFLATQQAGFDPALPPSVDPHQTYFAGRFSNGPLAFEYPGPTPQQRHGNPPTLSGIAEISPARTPSVSRLPRRGQDSSTRVLPISRSSG